MSRMEHPYGFAESVGGGVGAAPSGFGPGGYAGGGGGAAAVTLSLPGMCHVLCKDGNSHYSTLCS